MGALLINPNAASRSQNVRAGQQRRQSAKGTQAVMRLARALDFDTDALQRQTNGAHGFSMVSRTARSSDACATARPQDARRRLDKLERMAAQIGVDLMAHLAIVKSIHPWVVGLPALRRLAKSVADTMNFWPSAVSSG